MVNQHTIQKFPILRQSCSTSIIHHTLVSYSRSTNVNVTCLFLIVILMQIWNDFLVFKYPVTWKQKISKFSLFFFEINVNVCLLCVHHVMTSIILHTRRPVNKKSVTQLVFMFQLIYFFAFWGAEKHVFHIVPFCPSRYLLKGFSCLEVSNRVRNWNKVKNNIYVRSKLQLYQLELRIFINKLMWHSSLISQFLLRFVNYIV